MKCQWALFYRFFRFQARCRLAPTWHRKKNPMPHQTENLIVTMINSTWRKILSWWWSQITFWIGARFILFLSPPFKNVEWKEDCQPTYSKYDLWQCIKANQSCSDLWSFPEQLWAAISVCSSNNTFFNNIGCLLEIVVKVKSLRIC